MRIIRRTDYRRMPWKNGGDVTEEILSFPPDADLSTFGWRLSIAHVEQDGPFSVFAGVDRTIALLDGAGLFLDLPDETVTLSVGGPPYEFSGDISLSSRNMSGPTVDLNIMTRRGSFKHKMERFAGGWVEIGAAGAILFFNAAVKISTASGVYDMQRFDTALLEEQDGPVDLDGLSDVFKIAVSAAV